VDKLIITNCAADTSMHPDVPPRFADTKVLADSVEAACKAGATIAHIHAPPTDYAAWESHTRAIRDRCDVIMQFGISTQTVEQRRAVVKFQPEMMSVPLGAHNMVFTHRDMMMLHPREELAELMRVCRDNGVKPEFEVFHLGDLWLLDDLASKGLVDPPFMLSLFFGRPGGAWSPATAEEFIHRRKGLPAEALYCVSVTGPSHLELQTLSVLWGGHVRVGTEDEPYLKPGVWGDNVDHVARIATVSRALGREIASVAETRAMLKLPSR
jgi:3-keto-5-aminohexanoate cleavage enzyme